MTDRHPGKLPITAAVLAGGRSVRMGVDKTLLDVDGETLVARVTRSVLSVCADAIVVSNQHDAHLRAGLPAHVPVVTDEVPHLGPLGGLVTALAQARHDWVLAVAADMPWLQPTVVEALWALGDGADVVIPVGERGPEPLLALYRTSTCLPAAREAIEDGHRRLIAMFPVLRVVEVPSETLRVADPDLRSLVNVNTPEELAEVRAATASHSETAAVGHLEALLAGDGSDDEQGTP